MRRFCERPLCANSGRSGRTKRLPLHKRLRVKPTYSSSGHSNDRRQPNRHSPGIHHARRSPPRVGCGQSLFPSPSPVPLVGGRRYDSRRELRIEAPAATRRPRPGAYTFLVSVARRSLMEWVATMSHELDSQDLASGRSWAVRISRGATAVRQRITLLPSGPSFAVISKQNSRGTSSRLTSIAGDQFLPAQVSTLG